MSREHPGRTIASKAAAHHTRGMRKPQGIELEAFWDDQPQSRPCEHPGCRLPGEHRAPRSRSNVNEYYLPLSPARKAAAP